MQADTISKLNYESILTGLEQALDDLPTPACPRMIGELERLKVIVQMKMLGGLKAASEPVSDTVYLTVAEVSEKFRVTSKWLYRHKKQMPHSQPSKKCLLFPEEAITKWFASRKQH
jgi:hypothetical protein